jgi:gluconolactonase
MSPWFRSTAALALTALPLFAADNPLLAPGAKIEKLADGFLFTEGPAADRAGNIYFTDQPNDRIVRWDAAKGTFEDWMKPAGRANGMFFDSKGHLIACADEKNQLWSIAPDRTVTVLVKDFGGHLLNGPNDVWIRPDGGLYFTDPFYKRPYWNRGPIEQTGQHVYFLPADRSQPKQVTTDLRQPNGIVGSPDGKTLYVADIGAGKTYRYTIAADGSLNDKTLFCEMGSDGMTLDARGNVYLTGKGVTVFNSAGSKIAHFEIPEPWTANVRIGGRDNDFLFVTAGKAVYGAKLNVHGAR